MYYNIIFITKTIHTSNTITTMDYSQEGFTNYLHQKMKTMKKNEHATIYTVRPMYLYLIRRQKIIHRNPNMYICDSFEKVAYKKCIEFIKICKKKIKEKEKEHKLCNYYKLSLNNLKTYAHLYTHKDTITTLCIQKKLNGNNDVCRHILSYL